MKFFFSTNDSNIKHWIDISFEESAWKTNGDLNDAILKHSDLWMIEIANLLVMLKKKLKKEQKNELIKSQEYWINQFEAERKLIYSFDELQIRIWDWLNIYA